MKKLLIWLGLIKSEKPSTPVVSDNERWEKEGVNIQLTGEQYRIITIMFHYSIQYISNSTDILARAAPEQRKEALLTMEIFKAQLKQIRDINFHIMDTAIDQYPDSVKEYTKDEYSHLMTKVNGFKAK